MRKTKVFSQWLSLAATVQACSNRVATKNDPRQLNEHLSAEAETLQKEYKRLKQIVEHLSNEYEHSKELDPFRRYRELKGLVKRCVLHLHIKVDESSDDLQNSKEFSHNLEVAKNREGKYSAMTKEEITNENKVLRGQIRDLKRDCAIVRDCILQLERNYNSSKQLSPIHRYRIMKLMVKKVIHDRLL
ncbi:uncharacterized protein LOC134727277 [Mytilus trossulus]|uniref:uncharacterized protein LOC134727277 n=1 Tax=Mytilus trossulus TaxID=6551 RepID=UPI003004A081